MYLFIYLFIYVFIYLFMHLKELCSYITHIHVGNICHLTEMALFAGS
jgi:hypothetical protein